MLSTTGTLLHRAPLSTPAAAVMRWRRNCPGWWKRRWRGCWRGAGWPTWRSASGGLLLFIRKPGFLGPQQRFLAGSAAGVPWAAAGAAAVAGAVACVMPPTLSTARAVVGRGLRREGDWNWHVRTAIVDACLLAVPGLHPHQAVPAAGGTRGAGHGPGPCALAGGACLVLLPSW